MSNHPIIPPSELIKQLETAYFDEGQNLDIVLIQAYQAGADRELEACCHWLGDRQPEYFIYDLRAARRPKPPSLKEQALDVLQHAEEGWQPLPDDWDTIRRALEALPND